MKIINIFDLVFDVVDKHEGGGLLFRLQGRLRGLLLRRRRRRRCRRRRESTELDAGGGVPRHLPLARERPPRHEGGRGGGGGAGGGARPAAGGVGRPTPRAVEVGGLDLRLGVFQDPAAPKRGEGGARIY